MAGRRSRGPGPGVLALSPRRPARRRTRAGRGDRLGVGAHQLNTAPSPSTPERKARPMKITSMTTYTVPPRWLFLKIETDEGIVGWGEPIIEGKAATVAAAVDELSDLLIGKDPANIEDLWTIMYRGGFYRGGPI